VHPEVGETRSSAEIMRLTDPPQKPKAYDEEHDPLKPRREISDNLNVSNFSQIQKELKPNKIVNKGNSVFSNNHNHKLIQLQNTKKDRSLG